MLVPWEWCFRRLWVSNYTPTNEKQSQTATLQPLEILIHHFPPTLPPFCLSAAAWCEFIRPGSGVKCFWGSMTSCVQVKRQLYAPAADLHSDSSGSLSPLRLVTTWSPLYRTWLLLLPNARMTLSRSHLNKIKNENPPPRAWNVLQK